LDLLGFIRPNRDFSMGYDESWLLGYIEQADGRASLKHVTTPEARGVHFFIG
jgi:hypothetical protein